MEEGGSGTEKAIEGTVRKILLGSDMDEATEYKIRKEASDRLRMDLSLPNHKALVRRVVQSFLEEQSTAKDGADDEGRGQVGGGGGDEENEDDEVEDQVICKLTTKRKVTMQEFRGWKLVSIREYYSKGGKELPTSRGISLMVEQWRTLRKNLPSLQNAIKESRFT